MLNDAQVAEKNNPLDILKIDNQLCFALYAATRAITKTYRQRLEPMGITYPQYLVLLVLWEQDGLMVSELGTKLRLDSGTLTPLLKRLEASGLISRRRNLKDEREVRTWLTPRGVDLQTAALDARRYVACQLAMTEPEIIALRAELMALVSQLDGCGDALAED